MVGQESHGLAPDPSTTRPFVWASYTIQLCLSLFICKRGIIASTSQRYYGIKGVGGVECLGDHLTLSKQCWQPSSAFSACPLFVTPHQAWVLLRCVSPQCGVLHLDEESSSICRHVAPFGCEAMSQGTVHGIFQVRSHLYRHLNLLASLLHSKWSFLSI